MYTMNLPYVLLINKYINFGIPVNRSSHTDNPLEQGGERQLVS